MRRLAALAAALALAGCFHASEHVYPYAPSRAIVRSIPPAQAKAALRDVLGRATPSPRFGRLVDIEVTDDLFAYRLFGNVERYGPPMRYRYAEVAPHAYKIDGTTFLVIPAGEYEDHVWRSDRDYENIFFEKEQDVETLVDALESLKAAATEGRR